MRLNFPILCYLVSILLLIACKDKTAKLPETIVEKEIEIEKPKVSFTFDDGITSDLAGFKFKDWNEKILNHLDNENLKAIFFVTGRNKTNEKGQFLLDSWNLRNHKIANHTFTHPNFNSEKNTALLFKNELLKTDSIISEFKNGVKLFRFPYLKEGQNQHKVDSIRNILSAHGYTNGYVTIDASDWYVNQRLIVKILELGLENAEIDKFRDYYIQHILERADFYEKLSYGMYDRHVNHTLLLHHNLTSALFLGDLIKAFKAKGWQITNADQVFNDPIYKQLPEASFAGESLIYSQAKASGKYDQVLRYPAEDSRYEKQKMDELGL